MSGIWEPVGPWIHLPASTWVRATTGRFDGLSISSRLDCHSLLIQQTPGNTDVIYVLNKDGTGSAAGTATGTSGMIGVPTYNASGKALQLPWAQICISPVQAAINVAEFWLYSPTDSYVAVSAVVL